MPRKKPKVILNCSQCDAVIMRTQYEVKSSKTGKFYCSTDCQNRARRGVSIHNAGSFSAGSTPWNKDLKGIHLSPTTEFKPGHESRSDPVGTIMIRHHNQYNEDGDRRFIKIADPDEWQEYSRYVWEQHNGPVPDDRVVYHMDKDWLNDDIDNLILITRKTLMLINFNRIEI